MVKGCIKCYVKFLNSYVIKILLEIVRLNLSFNFIDKYYLFL